MSTVKIIKAAPAKSSPGILRGIVKRPVVDARAEARRIIAEAEAHAASVRESAEASAVELREAAYKEGYESALSELNQHLLDAKESRDRALAEVELDVLRLSVKIAEKIIGRELESNDATVADIVAAALRNIRRQETLVLRINPTDMPLVQTHRDRLDPTGRARFLDLVADPRVARGGCIIEGPSGTVNAQLETQLNVLERALLTRAPIGAVKEPEKQPKRRRRVKQGGEPPSQD
jgi:type III secretion protein L